MVVSMYKFAKCLKNKRYMRGKLLDYFLTKKSSKYKNTNNIIDMTQKYLTFENNAPLLFNKENNYALLCCI